MSDTQSTSTTQRPSPYDDAAFQSLVRKVMTTPKEEVERGLAEQKTARVDKREAAEK